MRLLFVIDGRSPIALNWVSYFITQGHEVHVVSTHPAELDLPLASFRVLALPFSAEGSATYVKPVESTRLSLIRMLNTRMRRLVSPGVRTAIRQRLIPPSLPRLAQTLAEIIQELDPDLVHAMRIPYEGMLAALAMMRRPGRARLIVSVWGNDFTLHAPATRNLERLTLSTLQIADAVHADCARDLRLAHSWKFAPDKLQIVLPGSGGVQEEIFYPSDGTISSEFFPAVVNPRGMRAYVRADTFFRAIPYVLEKWPGARFFCPTMAGEAQALRWLEELEIEEQVILYGRLSRKEMADLFRRCQIIVSPSEHDGTPNTLLEGLACGCFPIAGDIESLREWITPGVNGLLVDPRSPRNLANAILLALEYSELREKARSWNRDLIHKRAAYDQIMRTAVKFYKQVVS